MYSGIENLPLGKLIQPIQQKSSPPPRRKVIRKLRREGINPSLSK